jgi:hypothetical protein
VKVEPEVKRKFSHIFFTQKYVTTHKPDISVLMFLFKTSKFSKDGSVSIITQSNEKYEIYTVRFRPSRQDLAPSKFLNKISFTVCIFHLMAEAQLVSETLCHFYHINNTQSSQSFRIHSSGVYSFSLETIIQEKARPIFFHFLIPKTYPSPFEVFESTES